MHIQDKYILKIPKNLYLKVNITACALQIQPVDVIEGNNHCLFIVK